MRRATKAVAIAVLGLAVSLTAVDFAEARRAGSSGSFGSRGTRTYSAPPVTQTAPTTAAPIQRSMTPNTAQPGMSQPYGQPQRGGFFGGLGGSLMGGLLMGGLFGMLLGHGFGGGAGMLGFLFQMLLIGGAIMLAMRLFGRRREAYSSPMNRMGSGPANGSANGINQGGGFPIPRMGAGLGGGSAKAGSDGVGIASADLDTFEELLKEMQRAYAAEDYSALRRITTPEAMSYLAEELGDHATRGLRNDVKDVRLLQGDLAEAWKEGPVDYATVAMRYEAIDVLRNRTTGEVVEGDPNHPQESVEVWTFVRRPGAGWVISAIQSAG
ncbi:Tim44 domain-containing protein [Rhizobium paknamense]|uniref:Lipid-binding transport protein (Tim44 family) n=1 Tax=Rhizobium paknamense TaxID=1206817 RepID=A0ABU0IIP0_9HYPH|nr:Tim44 domain-containing protein [Rhizobium paknamense]MDQ0457074.1 putative lipid-binding transport protein (Tim44 family) [Rhizobium paknamense]